MATCKNCIHYLVCNLKGAGCRDENGVFGNETITMIQSVEVERNCEEYLPSDVAPVKHGHWILLRESEITGFNPEFAGRDPIGGYQCSNCKKEAILDCNDEFVLSSYCPNCGAKMDGDEQGNDT